MNRNLNLNPPAKVGDNVFIPSLGLMGEVIEIHNEIKGLATKVKVVRSDGKIEVVEVSDLVVEGVVLLRKIVLSDVFKALASWVKKLFKK